MAARLLRYLHPQRVLGRIVLIAFAAALPVAFLVLDALVTGAEHARADAEAQLRRAVDASATELSETLSSLTQVLVAAAGDESFEKIASGNCPERLGAIYRRGAFYRNMFLANTAGEIVCIAELIEQTINVADRDYFKTAMRSLDPVVGEVVMSRRTGRPILPVALSLRGPDGRPGGVIAANLDLGAFLESASTKYRYDEKIVSVWSARGELLARSPELPDVIGTSQAHTPLFQALQRNAARGGLFEARGLDGIPRLYAAAPLVYGGRRLWVAAGVAVDEVLHPIRSRLLGSAVALAAGLALVLAISGVASHFWFRKPLVKLAHVASRLAAGDRGARVGLKSGVTELVVLSTNFDRMAQELERRLDEQARTAAALREAKEQVEQKVALRTAELERVSADSLARANALAEAAAELSILSEMTSLLQTTQDLGATSPLIDSSIQRLFPGRATAVFLFRESRNQLELLGGQAAAGGPAFFSPDDCLALRLGHAYRVDRGDRKARCRHALADIGYVCVPMTAQGEVIGILSVGLAQEAMVDKHLVRLAGVTAEQLSLGLSNVKLRQRLRDVSIHDSLTGLYNRRFMDEMLARELARARREKSVLCVMMLDLDHFKRFNDTYGHEAGDLVLQRVGELLRNTFRGTDVCCRYGGEELMVILPNADPETVRLRADRLREDMKKISFLHNGTLVGNVSVSIGLAAFPDPIPNGNDLVAAADAALYEAKATGRDRVCVARATRPEAA